MADEARDTRRNTRGEICIDEGWTVELDGLYAADIVVSDDGFEVAFPYTHSGAMRLASAITEAKCCLFETWSRDIKYRVYLAPYALRLFHLLNEGFVNHSLMEIYGMPVHMLKCDR